MSDAGAAPPPDGASWVAGVRPGGPTSGVAADAFVEYLLRLGDDRLVLGHRLSEWCGHAPILEEDIALANFALDFVGQAAAILALAGQVEGRGRGEDALAYFREAIEFRNCLLVEQPRGDFAATIVRQFLFDAYDLPLMEALARGNDAALAGIAGKAVKEAAYHVRHSGEWMLMLGDGTAESHARAQRALDEVWRFTGELFVADDIDRAMVERGIAPELDAVRRAWRERVEGVVARATLRLPPEVAAASGGRRGRHTEHLGHMLAEMQILARSHPGASW